jgi:hypothetical protein
LFPTVKHDHITGIVTFKGKEQTLLREEGAALFKSPAILFKPPEPEGIVLFAVPPVI